MASVICFLFDSKALFVCFLFTYQEKYRGFVIHPFFFLFFSALPKKRELNFRLPGIELIVKIANGKKMHLVIRSRNQNNEAVSMNVPLNSRNAFTSRNLSYSLSLLYNFQFLAYRLSELNFASKIKE